MVWNLEILSSQFCRARKDRWSICKKFGVIAENCPLGVAKRFDRESRWEPRKNLFLTTADRTFGHFLQHIGPHEIKKMQTAFFPNSKDGFLI